MVDVIDMLSRDDDYDGDHDDDHVDRSLASLLSPSSSGCWPPTISPGLPTLLERLEIRGMPSSVGGEELDPVRAIRPRTPPSAFRPALSSAVASLRRRPSETLRTPLRRVDGQGDREIARLISSTRRCQITVRRSGNKGDVSGAYESPRTLRSVLDCYRNS